MLVFTRIQRRRHKSLVLAILTTTLFMGLLLIWSDPSHDTLSSVSVPRDCGYWPAILCGLFIHKSPEAAPFDPLAAQNEPATGKEGTFHILPIDTPGDRKPLVPVQPVSTKPKGTTPKEVAPAPEKQVPVLTPEMRTAIYSQYKGAELSRLKKGHVFYKGILKSLVAAKPSFSSKLDRYSAEFGAERFDDVYDHPMHTEKYLQTFLQVNETEIDALTLSHNYILSNLPDSAPSGLYLGDGIVFVGGGKFNWLTLLSIKNLRNKGCNLPIEVLIPTPKEYELNICANIFPKLNAKCIHLPTALYGDEDEFASHLSFKGYQYKSLAILLSSFENVLLMDSDNMAGYSPEHLLKSEPFLSSGLVVWPDYWRRSTSPSFYKIAGVKVSTTELSERYVEKWGAYKSMPVPKGVDFFSEVPYHERVGSIPDPSTESGQLMISKKSHLKALLLALYYNSYGPKYYYPMFSQGAQGEGDKETFLAATIVLKKPFYQVGKFLSAFGNVKNNEFKGHGMGQYDPVTDYELRLKKKEAEKLYTGEELDQKIKDFGEPKVLFLHANYPKLDPWALKEAGETIDKDGRHRLYGWSMRWRTGTDLESDIWNIMNTMLCEDKLDIDHFKEVNRLDLCKEIKAQMAYLKETASQLE